MKPLHLHIVLSTCNHLAFTGSRMTAILYAAHLGTSPAVIGMLSAMFGMVSAFTAVSAGRWIDRVGPRTPMIVASVLMICAGLTAGWWGTLAALFVACPVIGTFNSMFQIANQQTIGRYGGPQDRAANFSLMSLGTSTATFSGPLVAGLAIDHLSDAHAFLLLACFAFVPLPFIALRWLRFPPDARQRTEAAAGARARSVAELLRDPPLRRIYIVATINNAVWSVVSFLIPLYGSMIGMSATRIGALMACFASATVCVRVVLRWLLGRFRPWQLLVFSQLVVAVAFLAIPLTRSFPLLAVAVFWMGLGLGLTGPMSTSVLYDLAPPERVGEIVGLRVTIANLCQTFVPLASGALGAAIGVAPVFWALAAALAVDAWSNRRELFQGRR